MVVVQLQKYYISGIQYRLACNNYSMLCTLYTPHPAAVDGDGGERMKLIRGEIKRDHTNHINELGVLNSKQPAIY